ncbi:MAG: hypothetical protein J6D26_04850 [Clostridia bacterium]|nr:hypothetical protein [Clostridia bacterium]
MYGYIKFRKEVIGILYKEFVDIHSHVLPAVDDGALNMAQSLDTLRSMQSLGVTDVFLTPHYCKRRGHVTPTGKIRHTYSKLCTACEDEQISIRLHLGTEMEYSQDGARYIREGRVFTMGDTNYILVEFPPYIKSQTILHATREIVQMGLIPIIAHVERYESLYSDFDVLYSLKEIGVMIQVNIRSMCVFNLKLRKFLKRIIKERLADFLAGDVHTVPLDEKEIAKCSKLVIKYSSEEYLDDLMSGNAKKTILNKEIK